jgi:pyruvyltransferase
MKTLTAYWYNKPWKNPWVGNVGDILTPIILKSLLGREIIHSTSPGKILACGSIVEFVDNGDIVWGSGIISPKTIELKKDVSILAVRGPDTREWLIRSGYSCPEIYGDPAILMPMFYNPVVEKKRTVAIIPHYIERDEYVIKYSNTFIIEIINNPFVFIHQLLECERIITSSLHAHILAIAYNIPSTYEQLTNKIIGGYFKYKDFVKGQLKHEPQEMINSLKNKFHDE